MDIKIEIKQEPYFPQFCSQNGSERLSEDHLLKVKNEIVTCDSDYKMVTKTEVKEESFGLDFYSKHVKELRKVKAEMLTRGNDCETTNTENELEAVDSKFYSQNEGKLFSKDAIVMEFNGCNTQIEMVSKIEIKEEQGWMESSSTDVPSYYDKIMDGSTENFPSIQSPRLYKEGVSSHELALFSNEDFGKDESISMRKHSVECKSPRKFKIQESFCTQLEGEKVASETSCLKQNSLILQNNTHKHDSCIKYMHKPILVRSSDICEMTPGLPKLQYFVYEDKMLHKCNICKKGFPELSSLKTHSLIHEVKKPQKCDTCGKSFSRLSNLKKHKVIHEDWRPHKCDTCGKSFIHSSQLKRHKLIHEGQKPHKCDTCGKSFTLSSNLKKHKLIHEVRTPHKCDTCGKNFTQLPSLKKHILNHEGRKPHMCDTCGKGFAYLSDLKRHELIHEGRKPHKCDTCRKSFTLLSNLKKHKLYHEARKPHICDACGKTFTQLSGLNKHKLIYEDQKSHE